MSKRGNFLQRRMQSLCGKAMHGWRMVQDGDRVCLGLSGGKDSLSLLWLMVQRRKRVPIDYTIKAVHVEMGFGAVDHRALAEFCAGLEVEFQVVQTDYGPRAHTPENRENSPCFFCAMHRRRELFQKAEALGCNKLAFAHHQDDIIETFLMNSLYAGSISTMLPVQPFFKGKLVVLRPLALIDADMTRRFSRQKGFPVQPPCCPSAAEGKRARVRAILDSLIRENKKVRPSLWTAITTSGLDTLPPPLNMDPIEDEPPGDES